jgi:hypothetical protein
MQMYIFQGKFLQRLNESFKMHRITLLTSFVSAANAARNTTAQQPSLLGLVQLDPESGPFSYLA